MLTLCRATLHTDSIWKNLLQSLMGFVTHSPARTIPMTRSRTTFARETTFKQKHVGTSNVAPQVKYYFLLLYKAQSVFI